MPQVLEKEDNEFEKIDDEELLFERAVESESDSNRSFSLTNQSGEYTLNDAHLWGRTRSESSMSLSQEEEKSTRPVAPIILKPFIDTFLNETSPENNEETKASNTSRLFDIDEDMDNLVLNQEGFTLYSKITDNSHTFDQDT